MTVAAARRWHRRFLERVPPPAYFFACLLLGWGLDRWWPIPLGLGLPPPRLAVALPLFALATMIGAAALLQFQRMRTSPVPFGTPRRLLTGGPFRFSRNPLYVALVLTLVAFAAVLDSAWILASVPLLALALHRFIVPGEEARLAETFGEEYRIYAARVRRWI